jgi:hypothetical protein
MHDSANTNRWAIIFFGVSFLLWQLWISLSVGFAGNEISGLNARIKVLEDKLAERVMT